MLVLLLQKKDNKNWYDTVLRNLKPVSRNMQYKVDSTNSTESAIPHFTRFWSLFCKQNLSENGDKIYITLIPMIQ